MMKRFSPSPNYLALLVLPAFSLMIPQDAGAQQVTVTTTTSVQPITYIESYVFQGTRSRSRTKSKLAVTDNVVVLPNLNEILSPTPITKKPSSNIVKAKAVPAVVTHPTYQNSQVVPVQANGVQPRFGYGSGANNTVPVPAPTSPYADPLVPIDPIDPILNNNPAPAPAPVPPQTYQQSQPQVTTPIVPDPGVIVTQPETLYYPYYPFSHNYSPRTYYYSTPYAPYPVVPYYTAPSCRYQTQTYYNRGCRTPFSSRSSISLSRKSGLSFFFGF